MLYWLRPARGRGGQETKRGGSVPLDETRLRPGMKRFIEDHERLVLEALDAGPEAIRRIRAHHERTLGHLQAERFAHLIVLVTFGLLAFGAAAVLVFRPSVAMALLLLLLLLLFIPYIFHYYLLENSVQRWYGLANEMDRRTGRLSAPPDDTGPPAAGPPGAGR